MKRFSKGHLLCVMASLLLVGTSAHASAEADNFSFAQIDWYDEQGELRIPDSSWGLVEFDVIADVKRTTFVNVVAETGSGVVWLVRNFPIFPRDVGVATSRQGADFDITLLGLQNGEDRLVRSVSTIVSTANS